MRRVVVYSGGACQIRFYAPKVSMAVRTSKGRGMNCGSCDAVQNLIRPASVFANGQNWWRVVGCFSPVVFGPSPFFMEGGAGGRTRAHTLRRVEELLGCGRHVREDDRQE